MSLVLRRKQGESVVIADSIIVKVVRVRGKGVQLAFDAPRDVEIWRDEIRAIQCMENRSGTKDAGCTDSTE